MIKINEQTIICFESIYHVLLLAGDIFVCGHETSIVYTRLID